MTRAPDEPVRQALREAQVPGEGQAEERGWQVVREAFVEREPRSHRLGSRPRAALALLGAGLIAAFALTPAGADVREWIADAIDVGEEDARPVLGSLPAPGSVLVESREGVWVLNDDGSRRRLGGYDHATWSPNGLYIGASEGRELLALTPQGVERWRIVAPDPIRSLDWSADEGYRVAYVAGRELHVVAGDGTGDFTLDDAVDSRAIAWRPETSPTRAIHEIAYVDATNHVTVVDTDSREVRWRSQEISAPVESLQWAEDGGRLLMVADEFALAFEGDGTTAFKGPIAGGFSQVTLSPDGEQVAVVWPAREGGAELKLLPSQPGGAPKRVLYPSSPTSGAIGFGAPTFSPDGEWILLPWPQADQWIFVRIADRRVVPVGDISRQLDANGRGEGSFPRVAGWCC